MQCDFGERGSAKPQIKENLATQNHTNWIWRGAEARVGTRGLRFCANQRAQRGRQAPTKLPNIPGPESRAISFLCPGRIRLGFQGLGLPPCLALAHAAPRLRTLTLINLLAPNQLGEEAVLLHELVVGAALHDPALVQRGRTTEWWIDGGQ